jgi:hypothetical protein
VKRAKIDNERANMRGDRFTRIKELSHIQQRIPARYGNSSSKESFQRTDTALWQAFVSPQFARDRGAAFVYVDLL